MPPKKRLFIVISSTTLQSLTIIWIIQRISFFLLDHIINKIRLQMLSIDFERTSSFTKYFYCTIWIYLYHREGVMSDQGISLLGCGLGWPGARSGEWITLVVCEHNQIETLFYRSNYYFIRLLWCLFIFFV